MRDASIRLKILNVLTQVLVVVLLTLLATFVLRSVNTHIFDLNLDQRFWLRDFLGNLAVALLCLLLTQNWKSASLLSLLCITGFQLSNAGKLVVLGTPISPDDFINLRNLFYLWDGWMFWGAVATITLPALVFIVLVRWRSLITWLTLSGVGLLVISTLSFSAALKGQLDRQFGNSVWNQPENYIKRGLALHLVQESVRVAAKVGKVPSVEQVTQALQQHNTPVPDLAGSRARNVHMIVLESFYDPTTLGPDWVPESPFPAAFDELWAATDHSTALSPVFGGYTANAEFESLCGIPVTENAVFFEGWLRRQAPCLPAMLRQMGYRSIASHPNVAGFWNRSNAYRLIGFDTYWSKEHFDTTDAVGSFLLDHSYYEQVFALLDDLEPQPVFNYMLTYHGHLPYPTNDKYPDRVTTPAESTLLKGYLNHLYYKSRDLVQVLDELTAADPDALIIAFGDHLPYLGKNYGIHTDAGRLMPDRENYTGEMFEYLVSTPLIVIDGKRGPLPLGQVPLYRLPALIMQLLGASNGGITDWSVNPDGKIIRPVYGMHFYLEDDRSPVVCRSETEPTPACSETHNWLERMKTLSLDIFSGKQHSLDTMATEHQ